MPVLEIGSRWNSLSALAFITYPLSMASMALSFLAKTQYFLHPLGPALSHAYFTWQALSRAEQKS